MTAITWRLPDAPLRTSAVATKLTALGIVAALAVAARTGLPVSAMYALKAPAAFAAVMLVSFGFLQQHHPFSRFGAANQITTLRALLVSLIVSAIGEAHTPAIATWAAGAAVIVTMLDGLDGWFARRHRIASDFGARFDMETDALLILALSLLAWQYGKAGAWVVFSGLLRYAFIVAAARWVWLRTPLPSSVRRKTICVVQIAALTVALLPVVAPPVSAAIAALALLALGYSFTVDIVWLWLRAG